MLPGLIGFRDVVGFGDVGCRVYGVYRACRV